MALKITDEQIKFIRENYATMHARDIAKRIGVSQITVTRYARMYGIRKIKSPAFDDACSFDYLLTYPTIVRMLAEGKSREEIRTHLGWSARELNTFINVHNIVL